MACYWENVGLSRHLDPEYQQMESDPVASRLPTVPLKGQEFSSTPDHPKNFLTVMSTYISPAEFYLIPDAQNNRM